MTFDPARDFVPIALVSTTPNVIAVSARSPYRTVADIIQAARRTGAQADLRLAGRRFVGAPDRRLRGHGRHLDAACAVQGTPLPCRRWPAARWICCSTTCRARWPRSRRRTGARRGRDVGGARSVRAGAADRRGIGAAGLRRDAWFALYAPRDARARRQAIDRGGPRGCARRSAARFAAQGLKPGTLFGPELAAFEQDERRKWGGLVKDKGITAQ